jgi:hypothetical protein
MNLTRILFLSTAVIVGWALDLKADIFLTNNLVGYYAFSGNAADLSGHGNDGIVIGADFDSDRLGAALSAARFSNANQRIDTAAANGFPISTNDFTVSFWVKFANAPTDHQVFIANGGIEQFQIHTGPFEGGPFTQIGFQAGGTGAAYTPPVRWELGQWYNIQVVRSENTNITIFRDGVQLSKQTTVLGNDAPLEQRDLTFGSRPDGVHPFFGSLDEIRIYDRALTDEERLNIYSVEAFALQIKSAVQVSFVGELAKSYQLESSPEAKTQVWSPEGDPIQGTGQPVARTFPVGESRRIYRVQQFDISNGLVAYYPFAGNANDAIGTNNASVVGATLSPDRFGNPNQAYYFNGIDNYIQIPDSTNVFASQDFTVSMWFKSLDLPNVSAQLDAARFLISKGQNNFELHLGSSTSNTGIKFLPRFGIGNDWNADSSVYETNVWEHVIAVYKPSEQMVQVFINGVSIPLSGPSSTLVGVDNHADARLGMRTDGIFAFNGFLDSVRLYNRGLSSTEAINLFKAESAPAVGLIKAVKPRLENLTVGKQYQLQKSYDLQIWTDEGSPFTASTSSMIYPAYFDLDNGAEPSFRTQLVP